MLFAILPNHYDCPTEIYNVYVCSLPEILTLFDTFCIGPSSRDQSDHGVEDQQENRQHEDAA